MTVSSFKNDSGFSPAERDVFSLFASYPEINFDPEITENVIRVVDRQEDHPDELESSPISTFAEDSERSHLSFSTDHTTPLRPLFLLHTQTPPQIDTTTAYLSRVRQADLPEECRLCFTNLAQSIGAISAGMVPSTNGQYRINNTYFMDRCATLLRETQSLINVTKEQLKRIDGLKDFVIFKAIPADDTVWAMYRQRARMIISLVMVPSAIECQLIHGLARLYDTALYRPAQLHYDDNEIEPVTMRVLNKLYDNFFTWLADYKRWCSAMQDLKQRYMTPLVDRILSSETAFADIKVMQRAKGKAEAAIENPTGPSMLPMDNRVLEALSLSARRRDMLAKRTKTRMRRERTI